MPQAERRQKAARPNWLLRLVRRPRVQAGAVIVAASITAYLCSRHGECQPGEPERLACVVCAGARPLTVWLDGLHRMSTTEAR